MVLPSDLRWHHGIRQQGLPGEPLMTKMWLKACGEINHIFVVNFLGNFYSIDAVETPRMPMP